MVPRRDLASLLVAEVDDRERRLIARRVQEAHLPRLKLFDRRLGHGQNPLGHWAMRGRVPPAEARPLHYRRRPGQRIDRSPAMAWAGAGPAALEPARPDRPGRGRGDRAMFSRWTGSRSTVGTDWASGCIAACRARSRGRTGEGSNILRSRVDGGGEVFSGVPGPLDLYGMISSVP